MKHLNGISLERECVAISSPSRAITLLEKQAFSDMLERNLTQVVVVINILTGLKNPTQ
jgi:hypothetical protein